MDKVYMVYVATTESGSRDWQLAFVALTRQEAEDVAEEMRRQTSQPTYVEEREP